MKTNLPEKVWVVRLNYPGNKNHRKQLWFNSKPYFNISTFESTSWWNPFAGQTVEVPQEISEYVRAEEVEQQKIVAFRKGQAAGLRLAAEFQFHGVVGVKQLTPENKLQLLEEASKIEQAPFLSLPENTRGM